MNSPQDNENLPALPTWLSDPDLSEMFETGPTLPEEPPLSGITKPIDTVIPTQSSETTEPASPASSYPPEPLEVRSTTVEVSTETVEFCPEHRIGVRGTLNERGDAIRLVVAVRGWGQRGVSDCRLTTKRIPGLGKLRSNLPVTFDGDVLTWSLGIVAAGDVTVVRLTIPRTPNVEYLLTTDWPFQCMGQPIPDADVSLFGSAPSTVEAGQPIELSLDLANAALARADRVVVSVTDQETGYVVANEPAFPLAANEQRSCRWSLSSGDPGLRTYCATVDVDGRMLPTRAFTVSVTAAPIGLSLVCPDSCDLDETKQVRWQVSNPGSIALCNIRLSFHGGEEFSFSTEEFRIAMLLPGEVRTGELPLTGYLPGDSTIQARVIAERGACAEAQSTLTCRIPSGSNQLLDGLLAVFARNESRHDESSETSVNRDSGERHILFSLGRTAYTVPLHAVLEVLREPDYTFVPHTPDWIAGVTNVRGEMATIVDLARYFDLPTAPATRRALLLCQSSDGTIGFLVDEIAGIRRFSPQAVDRDLSDADQRIAPFIRGIAELGSRLVPVLDVARVGQTMESSDTIAA